jgi:putative ABC transport system permease protein
LNLLDLSQARFLRQAPWSTSTVVVGILLGVASVVAVHLISVRINDSLASSTPAYLREVNFLADKPESGMADYFALRRAWRAGEHPDIALLLPMVEGQLVLDGVVVNVVGVDALAGPRSVLPLAALPVRGLLASRHLAELLGYSSQSLDLESGLKLPLPGAWSRFQISAVFPAGDQRLLLADIGTAQELLGLPPESLTRVGIGIKHPWIAVRSLLSRLMPGFEAGFDQLVWSLPGWRVRALDSELPSQSFGQAVLFNLGALGSLALIVSWLLVYQVGLIWLRRRRRTMELLYLQGVSLWELRRGYLLSLAPLAFLASVAGIAAGWLLAGVLTRITTAGLGISTTAVALDAWLVGKALLSGLGISLAGGYLAFRQEWVSASGAKGALRYVIPLLLLAACLGIWWVTALWGAFLAIVAVCLLVVSLISPLLNWIATEPGRRVWQIPGFSLLARIGVRELIWYPRDLSVAIAALALAIATSMSIALMVDSFRQDFSRMLELRLADDLYVRSAGSDLSVVAARLEARADVNAISLSGRSRTRISDRPVELGFLTFDERQIRRYGLDQAVTEGQGIASERLLRDFSLTADAALKVSGSQIQLVGAFPGFGDAVPRLLVDVSTARRLLGELSFDRVAVASTNPQQVAEMLARQFPELDVQLSQPLRERALAIFDQTFAITRALTLLALLVACIGLYNALLGLRLNQQPTLRLLDAMGVSAGEIRLVQLARGLGIGLAVIGFALPLGLVMGWLLCHVVNPRAFGWSLELLVTPLSLLLPVLLGLVVIAVTSVLPAPGEKLLEASG